MQFVRFEIDGSSYYGILEDDKTIIQINSAPFSEHERTGATYNIEDVKLLTPCEPTKIFGVGLNFLDHVNELGVAVPKSPANFLKPHNSINNPYDNIVIPRGVERVDYEGELAIVVGKMIKDANVAEAAEAIFGVTPFNDLTERIISYTPNLVTKSKGFDTFSCFGPVLDTDIDWSAVTIRTLLNGKIEQEANTKDMIFSPAEILAYLSIGTTFYPGDIITTGTPEHVLEIKDGDTVEVQIEGININLKNPVYDMRKH